MKNRFKNPDIQRIYETYLNLSEEKIQQAVGCGSGVDTAFTWGYSGKPMVGIHRYPHDSWAYAAYCAGKELHGKK